MLALATQEEVGAHLDMTRENVRKLVNAGVMPPGKGRAGYDLDLCRVAYIRHVRGVRSGEVRPVDERDPLEYEKEKTRLTAAQADHEELKVRQLQGELIAREVVASYWQAIFASVRARLLSLPNKVAHAALAAKTLTEVNDAVKLQIHEALDELADTGIPDGYSLAEVEDQRGVETAADLDGKPVGGSKAKAKRRGKRGAGAMAN